MASPQQAAQENGAFRRIRSSAVKWSHHYRLKTHSMGVRGWKKTSSSLALRAFLRNEFYLWDSRLLSCLFFHQYKEPKDVFILGSVSFSGRWSSQHRERHKNIEMLFHLRTSFFLHYTRYQQEIKESGEVERGKGASEWNIPTPTSAQSP